MAWLCQSLALGKHPVHGCYCYLKLAIPERLEKSSCRKIEKGARVGHIRSPNKTKNSAYAPEHMCNKHMKGWGEEGRNDVTGDGSNCPNGAEKHSFLLFILQSRNYINIACLCGKDSRNVLQFLFFQMEQRSG